MTNTIAENEYQDCVQEMAKKLSDERKLSSDKNKRITELEEQIGQMVAFNVAFELWLQDELRSYNGYVVLISPLDVRCEVTTEIANKWHELKAQHLGDSEGE